MVNHIDWPRRRAYVEPTELAGRSRWVGASQPMHLELCQAIVAVLGGAESAVDLSKRAQAKLQEARADHPWVERGSTALIRRPSGVVEWWNFAGRTLNAVLAEHFRQLGMEAACDQVQVVFPANADLGAIRSAIQQMISDAAPIVAVPHAPYDLPELKFSACVPNHLLTQMLATRMDPVSALAVLCAQGCRVLHVP
jgi:ATP-dependent Lhr-like helicase